MAEESDIVLGITVTDQGTPVIEKFAKAVGIDLREQLAASGISLEKFEALLVQFGSKDVAGFQLLIDELIKLRNQALTTGESFEKLTKESAVLQTSEEKTAHASQLLSDKMLTMGIATVDAANEIQILQRTMAGLEAAGIKDVAFMNALEAELQDLRAVTAQTSQSFGTLAESFAQAKNIEPFTAAMDKARQAEQRLIEQDKMLQLQFESDDAAIAMVTQQLDGMVNAQQQAAKNARAAQLAFEAEQREIINLSSGLADVSMDLKVVADAEMLLTDMGGRLSGSLELTQKAFVALKQVATDMGIAVAEDGRIWDLANKKYIEGDAAMKSVADRMMLLNNHIKELTASEEISARVFDGSASAISRLGAQYRNLETIADDLRQGVVTQTESMERLATTSDILKSRIFDLDIPLKTVDDILSKLGRDMISAQGNIQLLGEAFVQARGAFDALGVSLTQDGKILNEFGTLAQGPVANALERLNQHLVVTKAELDALGIGSAKSMNMVEEAIAKADQRFNQAGTSIAKLQTAANSIEETFRKLGVRVQENGTFLDRYGQIVDGKILPHLQQLQTQLSAVNGKLEEQKQKVQETTHAKESYIGQLIKTTTHAALLIPVYSAVFTAMNAVTEGIKEAVRLNIEHQVSMTNLQNISNASAEQMESMARRIHDLNANLGSQAELTKGVTEAYRGLRNEGDSFEVLTAGAQLAKVANADVNHSVNAIIDVLKDYDMEASQAAEIANTLFIGISRGRGEFDQYAVALGRLLPMAHGLGVSFKEITAFLSHLSTEMGSAQQAGAAVVELLRNLLAHTKNFSEEGINMREVIGERGLMGLLRDFEPLWRKNDEALKQVVGGARAYNAIIATVHADQKKVHDGMNEMNTAHNRLADSFERRNKDIAGSWEIFKNELSNLTLRFGEMTAKTVHALSEFDKWIQSTSVGGPIIRFLGTRIDELGEKTENTASAQKRATEENRKAILVNAQLADSQNELNQMIEGELSVDEFLVRARERAKQAALEHKAAVDANAKAIDLSSIIIENNIKAEKEARDAIEQVDKAISNLTKSAQGLSPVSIDDFSKRSLVAAENLQKLGNSGRVSFAMVQDEARKMEVALIKAFGSVPDNIRAILDPIIGQVTHTGEAIALAFKNAGLKTKDELKIIADEALQSYERIKSSGQATPEQILLAWQRYTIAQKVLAGQLSAEQIEQDRKVRTELSQTPEGIAQSFKVLGGQLRADMSVTADSLLAHFKNIQASGQAVPATLIPLWENVKASWIRVHGELSQEMKRIDETIVRDAIHATEGIALAFTILGTKTKAEFQKTASDAADAYLKIVQSGEGASEKTFFAFQQALGKIDGLYSQFPANIQRSFDDLQRRAEEAGRILPDPYLDGFNKLQTVSRSTWNSLQADIADTDQKLELSAENWGRYFEKIADSGKVSSERLVEYVKGALDDLSGRFKQLPEAAQEAYDLLEKETRQVNEILPQIFKDGYGNIVLTGQAATDEMGNQMLGFTVKTKEASQRTAEDWNDALTLIVNESADVWGSGGTSARNVAKFVLDGIERIKEAGFRTLPPEFKANIDKAIQIARTGAPEMVQPLLDALASFGSASDAQFAKFRQQIDEMTNRLAEAASFQFGSDIKTLLTQFHGLERGTSQADQQARTEIAKKLAALGVLGFDNQGAPVMADIGGNVRVPMLPGGRTGQIAGTNVAGTTTTTTGTSTPGGGSGSGTTATPGLGGGSSQFSGTGTVINTGTIINNPAGTTAMDFIRGGVTGTNVTVSSSTPWYAQGSGYLSAATTPTRTTSSNVSTKPSGTTTGTTTTSDPNAGNSLAIGAPNQGIDIPSGTTVIGATPGATDLINQRSLQRFQTGGIVKGRGGVDSQIIAATPGEMLIAPQDVKQVLNIIASAQQRTQQPSMTETIIHMPLTINVSTPLPMGRQEAQAYVDGVLVPAIQQAINRRQLTVR